MSDALNLSALIDASATPRRTISMPRTVLALDDFAATTRFGGDREKLAGRSVVLLTDDALAAAGALIELDGLARRVVLCPPDFDLAHLGAVARDADAQAIVRCGPAPAPRVAGVDFIARYGLPATKIAAPVARANPTQWVLMTSGTTGVPKMVVHTLATLTSAIKPAASQNWATFYDIRRYGGLQIFLRAVAGRGSLTLPGAEEPIEDFLIRCGEAGVTHISGTPSHWRRVLMSQAARRMDPQYVRLSGEIADSAVLNALAALYPRAKIAHAYASTEAGVGFSVDDGLPGFPASYVEQKTGVAMRVVDGVLGLRSDGAALSYLGDNAAALRDEDGFVDTGDLVELRDGRYHFVGRSNGVINIGGAKVHPEEVEAIVNMQAGVQASLVRARKNPITGALVAADIVLDPGVSPSDWLRATIIEACRQKLAPHKVPAVVRFVTALAMTPGGKLARHG